MKRTVLWGFVLLAVCVVSFVGVSPIERKITDTDGVTTEAKITTPLPVTVENLPAVQTVSGNVNVGNLPAVQEVSGAVTVSNLPTDAEGRLLVVAGKTGPLPLIVRSTTTTYVGDLGGRTGATAKCRLEFPATHFASQNEIYLASSERGVAWLSSETDASWVDVGVGGGTSCGNWTRLVEPTNGGPDVGSVLEPMGSNYGSRNCSNALPVLCAE